MKKLSTRLRLLLTVFCMANAAFAAAQNTPIALGEWRSHLPYNKAFSVASSGNKIYCASRFGMFSYNQDDGSFDLFNRLTGLSDNEISLMRGDAQTGKIIVAYSNSNIDILNPDHTIVNVSDIKRKYIIGGKRINDILFIGHLAYLSCEFGIVVLDLDRNEVKDTYFIGPNGANVNVNALAYDGTSLLAASDSGIYMAQYNDPNIFNFNGWSKDLSLVAPNANYTSATSFNGKFYVVKTSPAYDHDTVLVKDNGVWSQAFADVSEGAAISSYNNYLVFRTNFHIDIYDSNMLFAFNVTGFDFTNANLQQGFMDSHHVIWAADFNNGLVRKQQSNNSLQLLAPNGPHWEAVWAMDQYKGKLWVASGALQGDSPNYDQRSGAYYFNDNFWKTYDLTNDTLYTRLCTKSPALVCVAVDPTDSKHAFMGSWGGGIAEFNENGGQKIYDESNSTLHSINGLTNYIITGGLAYDKDNNLWSVSGGNNSPLSVRTSSGTWKSFYMPDPDLASYGLYNLIIDDNNQKWFTARSGSSTGEGVAVFAENDINSNTDDNYVRLTDKVGHGALPSLFVRSLAKDKDGAIWLGTDAGVVVIYNPGNIFTGGNYDCQRVILNYGGYNQYLLETDNITAIAVDGANRKWFGTYSGGAFLMSADGTKQLLNFNTSNSPILSNSITDISINEETGEVFFGTDKGIISYRGDATEGGDVCSDYYVFPNPIAHDYTGPIAIRGLVANADVKITDIAGNVVYHTKANGGEAIWNGTNFKGERAQTGVYIVYITNEDGSATCTTKMLFAN